MKTWFITGCSTGFGRQLAQAVLAHGHRVVVAARDPEQVVDIAQEGGRRALALKLDVTDHEQVISTIDRIVETFGDIDVLVNNSGIGCFAAVEQSADDQAPLGAEPNVFGLSDRALLIEPSEFYIGKICRSQAITPADEIADQVPPMDARRAAVREDTGEECDDPQRAAMMIIRAADADNPPSRLSFGRDAYEFTLVRVGELRRKLQSQKLESFSQK
ncbi:short chain dehydrogenase [Streptosporangium subroseum]|uniref:Short chain dehydrogenase n=1 Tax=Streptosporangium subroseum TaxID=106412 RepID=A0A239H772_9ACTN|nr:SDR family NAD(P)-dependent oxidoreductase [Streptosporangium subroseum]SNS77021.1 short chain dehydrogenase [Streptosporangium subroseum]